MFYGYRGQLHSVRGRLVKNKIVRKIPRSNVPGVKTSVLQLDNNIIGAITLTLGQDIVDAFTTAFKKHFDDAVEQLENANSIVSNPKKIVHMDISARKFSSNNPTQLIDAGSNTGLQKLWNDAKNAGMGID